MKDLTRDELARIGHHAGLDPRTLGLVIERKPLSKGTIRRFELAAESLGISIPPKFFEPVEQDEDGVP